MIHNSKGNIEKIGELEIKAHDLTRRVYSPEGISPTLPAGEGGRPKILDSHKLRVRKLTPREYGRLQAFPVDGGWEQVVSDTQAYKQFGNAVTVNVVEAIARKIKDYLNK